MIQRSDSGMTWPRGRLDNILRVTRPRWSALAGLLARPWVLLGVDVLVALLLLFALLNSTLPRAEAPRWVGIVVAVAMCAGVAGRRWMPLAALVVTAVASGTSAYLGLGKDPMVALALVTYTGL